MVPWLMKKSLSFTIQINLKEGGGEMVNNIRDAVKSRLGELFPENPIYIQHEKQDLQKPCFFIQILETSMKKMNVKRYFYQVPFCIQYIPSEAEAAEELGQRAEKLMTGMEYIELENGDLLRGGKMKTAEEDGGLNFFVNYDLFVYKQKESEESMEKIEIQKGLVK